MGRAFSVRVLGTGGSAGVPAGRIFGTAGASGLLAGRVPGTLERTDGAGFSFGANGLPSALLAAWGLERGGVRLVFFLGAARFGSGAGASGVTEAGTSGVSGIRGSGDGSPSFS